MKCKLKAALLVELSFTATELMKFETHDEKRAFLGAEARRWLVRAGRDTLDGFYYEFKIGEKGQDSTVTITIEGG